MKLVAFVLHITNPNKLLQQTIYEKYLVNFDVIDAVMCKNGECLATCVSSFDALSHTPKCYDNFIKSNDNDGACSVTIMDIDSYDNLEYMQNVVYIICENYNNVFPQ
ncbi:ac117 [Artaxa digramma nucleopolyhedrovirus]|uniref:Ac117 n=1 Tax=Artaxa digramma nucleopolyhedrovirus TaxID=3070910 RepID=A0AAE6UZN1_9ABAC|nr:ac117 [Euproctis digramma nucleopolyhedrovirus]QHB21773.1 ac117 [Artaxa digramma nucleopolyhedrovirus]